MKKFTLLSECIRLQLTQPKGRGDTTIKIKDMKRNSRQKNFRQKEKQNPIIPIDKERVSLYKQITKNLNIIYEEDTFFAGWCVSKDLPMPEGWTIKKLQELSTKTKQEIKKEKKYEQSTN